MSVQALFDSGQFEECLKQCEAEIRFATTANQSYPLYLLASRAALQIQRVDLAKQHAETLVKLDKNKMVSWQTLVDALRATSAVGGVLDYARLGTALHTQQTIAKRNNAPIERIQHFSKEAALVYEKLGDFLLAIELFEDAKSPDSLWGQIRCFEAMQDTLSADRLLWRLVEEESEIDQRAAAAYRLLSRVAHVILEVKRGALPDQDEPGAWEELRRRVKRLESSTPNPTVTHLISACTLLLNEEDLSQFSLAFQLLDVNKTSSTEEEESIVIAYHARAWFFLASYALFQGDALAAWHAHEVGEELEQQVYARVSTSTTGGSLVIGHTTASLRAFTGKEIFRLVCRRSEGSKRVQAMSALSVFPTGIKAALRLADKVEDTKTCGEFIRSLVSCSSPDQPHSFSYTSNQYPWFQARMESFASVWTESSVEWTACKEERLIRQRIPSALAVDKSWVVFTCWQNRKSFPAVNVSTLQSCLDAEEFLPLALELMGKYYMGLDDAKYFMEIPNHQPERKRVRDPTRAIKSLFSAVQLDPAGLGALAVLANAYHAANQEDKARALYESVVKLTGCRVSPLLSEWCYFRLGQQQLVFKQFPLAAHSFQRAGSTTFALCGLGEANAGMGRLGPAMLNLSRALEINDQGEEFGFRIMFQLAQLNAKTGKWVPAMDLLRQIVSGPLVFLAQLELAEALLEQARYLVVRGAMSESRTLLREAKQLFLHHTIDGSAAVPSWKGLGDVCFELGELFQAKQFYLKAVHAEPWNSLAWFDLSRVLVHMKSPGATIICETCVKLDPSDASSWTLLGLSRKQDDVFVSQHCLIRSVQLNPTSLSWLHLAWLWQKEKPALSKRAFSQAQTLEPDSCEAWLGHFLLSHDTKALECAVDAAGFAPSVSAYQAMVLLAQSKVVEKEKEDVVRAFDVASRGVQLNENRGEAWALLAISLLRLGVSTSFTKRAFLTAQSQFELGFKDNHAQRMRINVAIGDQDKDALVALLSIAEERNDKDDEFWLTYGLGQLHLHQKRYSHAIEFLERAIALTPANFSDFPLRLDWLEALVKMGGDDEFTLHVAQEIATDMNATTAAGSANNVVPTDLLQRFSALSFRGLLEPALHMASNPLFSIWQRPWMAKEWKEEISNSTPTAITSALSILVLSEENAGFGSDDVEQMHQAGTTLLARNYPLPIISAREKGYWTRSQTHDMLRRKLQHLCPWHHLS